jgi:hypothetical protein
MTDPRQTSSWDAIRHAVVAPIPVTAPVPKATPVAVTPGVSLPTDVAAGSSVPGGIAPSSVGLHGATDKEVKAEITAKAEEFQDLQQANTILNKGQDPSVAPEQPAIDATVTVTKRSRNGQVKTEKRTVGWLSQYEQLAPSHRGNRFAGQGRTCDKSYSRNVDQVVGIADSILNELSFMRDSGELMGRSYRDLADAVTAAKAAPKDRSAMLALYGEMITFVQIVRQTASTDTDFTRYLQDNFDAFSGAAQANGGLNAMVQTILTDLRVNDVAGLQRQKLGMSGAAVTGQFDATTYFATQLYVIEQMASNLSRRDGLGMAAMQQSVKDAQASVDRIVDLSANFADRLRKNDLSPATRSFLTNLGYQLDKDGLKTKDGAAVADSQLGALSSEWLAQATNLAKQSHQDVQDAMSLHGSYLTKNQRKQVDGWVRAYELLYSDTMTRGGAPTNRPAGTAPLTYSRPGTADLSLNQAGTAPEQPDATDAMAVAALATVAAKEAEQPAPVVGDVDSPAETTARLQRSAESVQESQAFFVRLRTGVAVSTMDKEERQSVAILQRYGYIRQEGDTVTLTATDAQMRDFDQMAHTFKNPESPAAAAILSTVIKATMRVTFLAVLKDEILGIPTLASEIGTLFAVAAPAPGSPAGVVPDSAAAVAPVDSESPDETPNEPIPDPKDPPKEPVQATPMPSAPSASPGRISLLSDWPDEVQAQRDERVKRAEQKRQEAIDADRAYADSVQAKGAEQVRSQRQDLLNQDTRIVRGADGQAVGVVTTGDGHVIGVAPAVDPGQP